MRKYFKLLTFFLTLLFIFHLSDTSLSQNKSNAIAVLELFTSEGCSSCPPAEKLLNEISKKAKNRDLKVYCLAFHVDYWNHLGWKDRFSDPAYTQRQRDYGYHLGLKSIYTPQLVVNGTSHVVGSDKNKVADEIEKALDQKNDSSVSILVKRVKDRKFELVYNLKGKFKNRWLQIALIEDNLKSHVTAGENDGESLHQDNVVRQFHSLTIKKANGIFKIIIPKEVKLQHASIIVFIQNPDTMEISAADYVNILSKSTELIKFK